jgi:hypothetical protein
MAEPFVQGWRVVPIGVLVDRVRRHVGAPVGRPAVLAVDGRSSGGKTTLADRLAAVVPGAVVVHTDDVAWWHAAFDWVNLLVDGVLAPVRRGAAVSYRPPKWDERGRAGAIEVPTGASLVIIEGVGAGRRELTELLDGVVWVQTDPEVTARRDAVRVAAGETTPSNCAAWMAEEGPFVAAQRAWERAFVTVCGAPTLPHDPRTDVVIGQDDRPVSQAIDAVSG